MPNCLCRLCHQCQFGGDVSVVGVVTSTGMVGIRDTRGEFPKTPRLCPPQLDLGRGADGGSAPCDCERNHNLHRARYGGGIDRPCLPNLRMVYPPGTAPSPGGKTFAESVLVDCISAGRLPSLRGGTPTGAMNNGPDTGGGWYDWSGATEIVDPTGGDLPLYPGIGICQGTSGGHANHH